MKPLVPIKIPDVIKSLVSKNNNAVDMKIKITTLEIKFANCVIASDILGISWINIERNFDWLADFKLL